MKLKKKKKKRQGSYLKEATFDFLVPKTLNTLEARDFLLGLIEVIGTKLVRMSWHELPPGWDVQATIKESCIYMGFWGEYGYVHLIVSSCKNYNTKYVEKYILNYFGVSPKTTITNDTSIKKLLETLK